MWVKEHHDGETKAHTPDQIIRKLREADRMLGEGAEVAAVALHLGVSEQTYHRWRNQYGGLKAGDAKRLKKILTDKEPANRRA